MSVFIRESTGLVKVAGFWDAVSINIANMSIGAALATMASHWRHYPRWQALT